MGPEGIRLADLMTHKLTYELEYKLAEAPEFLTFTLALQKNDAFRCWFESIRASATSGS
jgi:hypothetical protein